MLTLKCSKNIQKEFFDEIFLKPQVLIDRIRLRMFLVISDHLGHPIPPLGFYRKCSVCPKRDFLGVGYPSMFERGYGVSQVTRHHQKHAESTYLDEYLRFKKNLVEKFLLDIF